MVCIIHEVEDATEAVLHGHESDALQAAHLALRESEQNFHTLAEAVPQIVWTTGPDGKNTYFNQQWVDYTGMTLEESRGDGWNTPFHPDDRQRAWDAWQRATQEDAPYSLECRLRRADGAYRWWLVRGAPLRDADGEIVKWFGTCTDVEELKQADEEVRRLNAELGKRVAERTAQLLRRQAVLELLQELTTVATSSLALPEIGGRVLELMHQRLGLAVAQIHALADDAGVLRALALIGYPDDVAAGMRTIPVDEETTVGLVVSRDLAVVTHESNLLPPVSAMRLRSAIGSARIRGIALPLKKGPRILGVLALIFIGERSFTEEELSLYRSIADLLGSAFANARAYEAEAAAKLEQATQEERTRLARDLHDSITQALFAAALNAEALMQDDAIPTRGAEAVAEVRRLTRGALAQMRTLLLELRSGSPADVPIEQLLRSAVEATEGRTSMAIDLALRGELRPPPELHTAIYRVTQEALNNVVRHAGATNVTVELVTEPTRVRLMVQDDGCGFENAELSPTHVGIRSMRERAAEVGAALRVVSAPGEGTLVMLDWLDDEPSTVGSVG